MKCIGQQIEKFMSETSAKDSPWSGSGLVCCTYLACRWVLN